MLDFSKSYFDLLGLPEKFTLDMRLLEERYLAIQQVVHPDRYANASDQERRLALQESGLLNEAVRVLKDPLARAAYLLKLCGCVFDHRTTTDPIFLMQQMGLREELAEAKHKPDPYGAVADIINKIQIQKTALFQLLEASLEAKLLDQAQEILYKLQFLERLRRNADELEAFLDERL